MWEWMFAWWQQYCSGDDARRLAIVVVRDSEQMVGILPGYVHDQSSFGFSIASYGLLGTEYESSDYLEVIEHPVCRGALLQGMLQFLVDNEHDLDVLTFNNVLSDHPMLHALEGSARRMSLSFEAEPHRLCPYITISGDWQTYLAGLSSKMRKNVRRYTRQLEETGVEFDWVRDRTEVRQAVSELFALHARRFEFKGADTGFRAEQREPFHSRVSETFFDLDILRLFRLRAAQQTIASLYCFEYAGALFYVQAGIDPDWDKQSAGTVLVGHAIRYAFDHQLAMFDFMRGSEEYKFRWTATSREIIEVRLGVSWKGRAVLHLRQHERHARALAKQLMGIWPAPRVAAGVSGQ
jgi:CelD/BcsL family acetyltransferase involved in cellulose biosynthesis